MVLGIDPPTNDHGLGDLQPIADWLGKAPEQAETIEEIIRQRVRQKRSSDPDFLPSTWRYFSEAIDEGLQFRARRQAEPDFDPVIDQQEAQDRAHLRLFYEKKPWRENLWGPPPGQPGCRIPPPLIAEFEEKYRGGGP